MLAKCGSRPFWGIRARAAVLAAGVEIGEAEALVRWAGIARRNVGSITAKSRALTEKARMSECKMTARVS